MTTPGNKREEEDQLITDTHEDKHYEGDEDSSTQNALVQTEVILGSSDYTGCNKAKTDSLPVHQTILVETSDGSANGKSNEHFEKEQNNNINQTLGDYEEPYEVGGGGRSVDEDIKTGITATNSAEDYDILLDKNGSDAYVTARNDKDKEANESCESPNLSAPLAEENKETPLNKIDYKETQGKSQIVREDQVTPDSKESKTFQPEIRGKSGYEDIKELQKVGQNENKVLTEKITDHENSAKKKYDFESNEKTLDNTPLEVAPEQTKKNQRITEDTKLEDVKEESMEENETQSEEKLEMDKEVQEDLKASTQDPEVSPEDPDVSPEDPDVSPEDPEVSPEDPEVSPQDPEVSPQDPEVSPEDPEVSPQDPEVSPDDPEVSPQDPEVLPQYPDVLSQDPEEAPQDPEVSSEDPEVAPEDPDVSPQDSDGSPRDPEVSPEDHEVSPEDPKVSSEDPEVSPQDPEVSPQDPDVSPQDPEVSSEDPEVSPEDPEVSPQDPDASPQEPEVSPQDADVSSKNPDISPQDPDVSPQEPEVSPQDPDTSPQEPEVSPQEPDVSPQEPDVSSENPDVSPQDPEVSPQDPEVSPQDHHVSQQNHDVSQVLEHSENEGFMSNYQTTEETTEQDQKDQLEIEKSKEGKSGVDKDDHFNPEGTSSSARSDALSVDLQPEPSDVALDLGSGRLDAESPDTINEEEKADIKGSEDDEEEDRETEVTKKIQNDQVCDEDETNLIEHTDDDQVSRKSTETGVPTLKFSMNNDKDEITSADNCADVITENFDVDSSAPLHVKAVKRMFEIKTHLDQDERDGKKDEYGEAPISPGLVSNLRKFFENPKNFEYSKPTMTTGV